MQGLEKERGLRAAAGRASFEKEGLAQGCHPSHGYYTQTSTIRSSGLHLPQVTGKQIKSHKGSKKDLGKEKRGLPMCVNTLLINLMLTATL